MNIRGRLVRMEYLVKESLKLDEGKHEGVVVRLEYRESPYKYTDVIIECNRVELKAGYPSFIAVDSKLGLLLQRFGVELKAGSSVKDDVLVGRKCSFLTVNEASKKDGKTYARVLQDTVRPL